MFVFFRFIYEALFMAYYVARRLNMFFQPSPHLAITHAGRSEMRRMAAQHFD